MNAKKAKGLRKLIRHAHGKRPKHAFTQMTEGFDHGMVTVAQDTQRGQYIAIKNWIKGEYGK
jgi:hypothetical protein